MAGRIRTQAAAGVAASAVVTEPVPAAVGVPSARRPVERLSAAAARRVALAAQGFADRRPNAGVDVRHLRRVLDRVGVLQIDSVNVLSRSHYLPVFARLGHYDRPALDALAHRRRELFEYWAHEASYLPIRLQPQLRWRMARAIDDAWGRVRELAERAPEFIEAVYDHVAAAGPSTAAEAAPDRPNRGDGMWGWHDGKVAMEWLFWSGRVTAVRRGPGFERVYDLTERVIPAPILAVATPSVEAAQRELIRVSARSHGVATEPDLRDYFRLRPTESKARVAELVEAGELWPVEVEGWRDPAYLWPEARTPRRVAARALLSPFDSLIWERKRTERIFDVRFRLEIYTPAAKRQHGYYVLPFLLGERIVARVDLKADRQAGLLRVLGAFAEPSVDSGDRPRVVAELAAELRLMAGWLELDGVAAGERGDLAGPLSAVLSN